MTASLAPIETINSIRRPQFIYTTSYLNDPIKFPADPRFLPISAIQQLDSYTIVPKDLAGFNIVELNTTGSQFYATQMYSRLKINLVTEPDGTVVDTARRDYARIFDTRIKQLPIIALPNT